ncbi:MAG: DUF922 domain-containing Zn-dependent protease [Methanotrichaceae archaeon]|nr:DUF922 domain-containing Zn-dependent protease [Methanotrichaceae archaeon]
MTLNRVLMLIALLALIHNAACEPPYQWYVEQWIPNAKIQYYDISGTTEEELYEQLQWLAPAGDDGKKHWSVTHWDTNWEYSTTEDEEGNCQIENAQVDLDVEVEFPRWIPPKNTSSELVAEWENFIKALAEHENGHVKFVNENSGAVNAAISGLDCYSADGAASSALGYIEQLNNEYDDKTNHGGTKGAIFPPSDNISVDQENEWKL